MTYSIKRYGWIRDIPDQRDHLYAAPVAALVTLPSSIDLRSQCPPITEQVMGGHCVVAVGYDDAQQRCIVRNSWGTGWESKGTARCPMLT